MLEHEGHAVALGKAGIRLGHVRDPSDGVLRVAPEDCESVLLGRDLAINKTALGPPGRPCLLYTSDAADE